MTSFCFNIISEVNIIKRKQSYNTQKRINRTFFKFYCQLLQQYFKYQHNNTEDFKNIKNIKYL